MDRGESRVTVHGVTKSQARLSMTYSLGTWEYEHVAFQAVMGVVRAKFCKETTIQPVIPTLGLIRKSPTS